MKQLILGLCFVVVTGAAICQSVPHPPAQGPAPAIDVQLANTLQQLQVSAQDANVALGKLRIEKWKTDGNTKQQTQSNVDSLQRNLTAALPELIEKVRLAPQDLSASFKLYRNLSAEYDVLASVAESTGAFGPKDQYQALSQPLSAMDSVRRSLADRIDSLAVAKESELSRLRAQVQSAAAAQASAPVKKIVVDDNQPAPKSKKTKAKTSTPAPSSPQ